MADSLKVDETRWLSDREQAAWRAFLDMQARLGAQLNRELQDAAGLSQAEFAVLVQLSEHPDARMRVLELARYLRWEKSRLSHQLTRMQQRGLLARTACNDDRRGAWVTLSDVGRAALTDAAPLHVAGVRRYLFDGLSDAQVTTLETIARGTVERLAEVDEARCASAEVCGAGD